MQAAGIGLQWGRSLCLGLGGKAGRWGAAPCFGIAMAEGTDEILAVLPEALTREAVYRDHPWCLTCSQFIPNAFSAAVRGSE